MIELFIGMFVVGMVLAFIIEHEGEILTNKDKLENVFKPKKKD